MRQLRLQGRCFREAETAEIQYDLRWTLLRRVTVDGGKNEHGAEKAFV